MDDQPPAPLSAPSRGREIGDQPTRPPFSPAAEPQPPERSPPGEPRSGLRSALWLLLVLAIVAGGAAWLVLRAGQQPARTARFQSSGPMPVGTARVEKGDMPITLGALGTVTPLATVTLKTQIAGQLIEIGFQEGQMVKKGDFLAQIDPRPYQVALAQAQGQLARNQAVLKNAELDLARYRTLVAQNSLARQTLDTQAALVEQNRGTVQSDQAQVDTQKLNLTYARIVAPIGGRVGLRQIDLGNYVQASDPNGLVVISQLQPISVIFTLAEDNLRAVLRRMNAGARLAAIAFDRTGTTQLASGTLETVDNQIDTSTGTVKLRAIFANAEQILFPNQFVNIQLLVETLTDATLVPIAAIQRGAPGTFVYQVKPDETVAVQKVTVGPGDNQRIVITKGLEPGDRIVIDGADRLKDGAKVRLTGGGPPPAATTPATIPAPGAEPGEAPAPAGDRPRGQGRRRSAE